MSKRKFDTRFKTPMQFTPDGLHVSRRMYTRRAAAKVFENCLNDEIFAKCHRDEGMAEYQRITVDPQELKKSWVRWGFQNWSPDLPSPCWLVCSKDDHAAQPTWELL